MIIRVVLLLGLLAVGMLVLRSTSPTNLALRRLAAAAFLTAAAGAVIYPSAVTWVAHLLGVGRGTDLVLYLLVLAFLCSSVSFYRRSRALEDRLVALARRVAIAETLSRESHALTIKETEGSASGSQPHA